MTENEFKNLVEKMLGVYLASHEDASFGVLSDGSFHFDCWGWIVGFNPSTGLWNFSAGRGVVGEGKSIEEAVQIEKRKYKE